MAAFAAAQHRRIDHIAAHGPADRLHRALHDGEERRAGVLHQVPSVGDLYRLGATIGGGLVIAGTTIPRDDVDRGSRGKPCGSFASFAQSSMPTARGAAVGSATRRPTRSKRETTAHDRHPSTECQE
jgi:hypothetical protein